MNLLIKVGSITNAQRGVNILRSSGYKGHIKRIENPNENDGCGYAIAVRSDTNDPVRILRKNGINVRGVEHD